MAGRTFAVGDVHGDMHALIKLLMRLPLLTADDTLVFVGDYVDRGPQSAQVVDFLRRELPRKTPARVVTLRGNHEDAWLRVRDRGWDEFVYPLDNGCLPTYRSFVGGRVPAPYQLPTEAELAALRRATFFPPEVIDWMRGLPCFYEDEHAIYVHAGLPKEGDRWLHPSALADPQPLLWLRNEDFFRNYRGKRVVFGHTTTPTLPQELSHYTVDDPTDLFAGENVIGLDTGAGNGGFLSAIELPAERVWESR